MTASSKVWIFVNKLRITAILFTNANLQMEVDHQKGEGFRSYYIQKIEELQLIVNEKGQNLRRLQAQRNELNAKGNLNSL